VVAWFSPEKNRAHHCERAIRAALELLRNAERFREPWRRAGLHPFGVGVGINTGPMAVGVLDAHRHIEPTVIGDSVNLAARIESLTREDAPLLVSEATLAPVRDRFIARSIGEVAVVGRVQTVHLYEIQGLDKDRASAPASNPRLQDLP
jgi:adenylate cyclase